MWRRASVLSPSVCALSVPAARCMHVPLVRWRVSAQRGQCAQNSSGVCSGPQLPIVFPSYSNQCRALRPFVSRLALMPCLPTAPCRVVCLPYDHTPVTCLGACRGCPECVCRLGVSVGLSFVEPNSPCGVPPSVVCRLFGAVVLQLLSALLNQIPLCGVPPSVVCRLYGAVALQITNYKLLL